MYAFDENGNVLIDTAQADLIAKATRNRTISRRAQALSQNQFIPFQPITMGTWTVFQRRLGEMFAELFQGMKVPHRGIPSPPRGANDFRSIYFKALNDWASVDLQGFQGTLPAAELNGLSEIIFFLPADGAVIRYLDRLLRKFPGFFTVSIGPGNAFTKQITTIDNAVARVKDNPHGMTLRVKETFGGNIGGRTDSNVSTLKAILRTMEIRQILAGLNKILTTLSRKLHSPEGTWGEEPRFPIVNFQRKVDIRDWMDLATYGRNFHGNNKELYADKNVYGVIAAKDKLPFAQAVTPSGEHKWTQPQS